MIAANVISMDANIVSNGKANFGNSNQLLDLIRSGQLLVVNSRRKNGLILYKGYYAEFAGPGAAIGGLVDASCWQVIPVGDLSIVQVETAEEREKAYKIRRQWVQLIRRLTDLSSPTQRGQSILEQLENYFDTETIAALPDEALALLVGVFPQTVRMIRYTRSYSRGRKA